MCVLGSTINNTNCVLWCLLSFVVLFGGDYCALVVICGCVTCSNAGGGVGHGGLRVKNNNTITISGELN